MTIVSPAIYSHTNLLILLGSLNNLAQTKYEGMTNQILDNKYFAETNGSSLVIVVINIQINIMYITIEIGWRAILLSNFFSYNNFAIKKNRTPNNNGSTGTDNDSPMLSPSPSRLMDNGVKNAIRNKTFSYEKKYNISTPNKIGSAYIR